MVSCIRYILLVLYGNSEILFSTPILCRFQLTHFVFSTFPDIAMHKRATQSSTSYNGFPTRAVDGNFKSRWADKSCTHTRDEQNPWWRVDLGQEYIVTGKGPFIIYRGVGSKEKWVG